MVSSGHGGVGAIGDAVLGIRGEGPTVAGVSHSAAEAVGAAITDQGFGELVLHRVIGGADDRRGELRRDVPAEAVDGFGVIPVAETGAAVHADVDRRSADPEQHPSASYRPRRRPEQYRYFNRCVDAGAACRTP